MLLTRAVTHHTNCKFIRVSGNELSQASFSWMKLIQLEAQGVKEVADVMIVPVPVRFRMGLNR